MKDGRGSYIRQVDKGKIGKWSKGKGSRMILLHKVARYVGSIPKCNTEYLARTVYCIYEVKDVVTTIQAREKDMPIESTAL